jgi:hypothetical protein
MLLVVTKLPMRATYIYILAKVSTKVLFSPFVAGKLTSNCQLPAKAAFPTRLLEAAIFAPVIWDNLLINSTPASPAAT